jgi:predicted N-formylglutamate amidohydrolase
VTGQSWLNLLYGVNRSSNAALAVPESFESVETIEGDCASGLLLLCDHASNGLPAEYGSLGLPPEELARHIGWDIGAAAVTRLLAARFRAPAILTTYSRLLIDPNRGADDPTLVMRISDGALVPGNARIDAAEIARRTERFHRPYHEAIAARLDQILAGGTVPIVFSVHSFTPVWRGQRRPWQIAFLWDKDPRVAQALISHFRRDPALIVGDNEPYDGCLEGDTLYQHATARGLPHALVELRQDLVATSEGAADWAERLALSLAPLVADKDLRRVEHWGSRAGPEPMDSSPGPRT